MSSSKLQQLKLVALLCLYYLVSVVFAMPLGGMLLDKREPVEVTPGDTKITVPRAIAGVILIIIGIIFCFFGRRFYRITIFLLGFYIGAVLAWIALQNASKEGYTGSETGSEILILVVSLVAGLLLGVTALCCSTFVVYALGGLAAYLLALFILSFADGGVIKSRAGRIIFIVAFIVVGLVLTILFTDMAIIVGTAFIGAFSIIMGADMFARTGFAETFDSFQNINRDTLEYHTSGRMYGMLVGLLLLFALGVLVQWRFFRTYKFGHHEKRRGRFGWWHRRRA